MTVTGRSDIGSRLFRTDSGKRLHIRLCPFMKTEPHEASAAEIATYEVCTWCQKELDGTGRSYFATLEPAMEKFKQPVETRAAVRQMAATLTYDAVWIPNSNAYIALGHGGPSVAWIGKSYVMPVGGELVKLPGFLSKESGAHRSTSQPGTCPVCHEMRSLSGQCRCT